MKIETKYEIGDKIWIVYKEKQSVGIYYDFIHEIAINKDNNIIYYTKYTEELEENEIILYHEKDKLLQKIEDLLKSEDKTNE